MKFNIILILILFCNNGVLPKWFSGRSEGCSATPTVSQSGSRLMWSQLMLSSAYCDQIAKDPFAQHYNISLCKNPVIVIIQLMISVSLSPKVITLSSFHCITICFCTNGKTIKLSLQYSLYFGLKKVMIMSFSRNYFFLFYHYLLKVILQLWSNWQKIESKAT